MELSMAPASPPPALPRDFRLDSAATSPYATAPSSPHGRRGTSAFAEGAVAGAPFLTAPPSPNPFDLLPPSTPRLTGAGNPFDRFQHFTSAPASPRRAAAIYAHFAETGSVGGSRDGGDRDDDGDEEEFQQRGSYATSVPFDWEERPGTPKARLGGGVNSPAWDADFDFGTAANNAPPEQELTTADELFEKGKIRPLLRTADEPGEKGKIRPLKPPPGLLDGGSVASSPRSPMARGGGMRSPRRRSRVGSGVDFDPFAAALLEATKAPSPLGGKESKGDAASDSPRTKRPASRSAGWRRWRLSDLLLFRSSSDAGRVNNKDPIFKFSQPQKQDAPFKKVIAQTTTTGNKVRGNGYDMFSKAKKQQGSNRSAAAAADGVAGCARLSPLQRLAKGLGAYSWHHGRRVPAPATKV